MTRSAIALAVMTCCCATWAADDWPARLQAELKRVPTTGRADFGVYVRDLDTGRAMSFKADESWYLASTIKLPVALAVLQHVQRGVIGFETPVTLRAGDYVDGAGPTKRLPVGAQPTVRWLLEQMMTWSDNTASDLLIGLVGLRAVNELVQQQVPQGFQPITTLADVRRRIYGQLTPAASRLSGQDFLLLDAQKTDAGRRHLLARLLHVPESSFKLASVAEAYDAYYASGVNSARLDAYGELLARFVQGQVLDGDHTAWLLQLMERARTGPQRIRAGLPPGVRWAHKTGTQNARTCDSGLVTVPSAGHEQRVVVATCTRGERSLASAERELLQVGAAICHSGLLRTTHDTPDLACRVDPKALAPVPALEPGVDADTGLR